MSETQEAPKEEKKGTEWVDFEELPEEIRGKYEERFKRIYGHNKQSERVIESLSKDMRSIIDRLDAQEQAQEKKKLDDKLSELKGQKVEALKAADYDRVTQIDEQIIEEKTKEDVKPKVQDTYQMSPQMVAKLTTWASELDNDGNMVRPWADPAHPKHQKMLQMATAIMQDPDFDDPDDLKKMEKVLGEVDRLFVTPKATRNTAQVLSGESVRNTSKNSTLTEAQKFTARKMGMSEEKYAEALKKYGTGR